MKRNPRIGPAGKRRSSVDDRLCKVKERGGVGGETLSESSCGDKDEKQEKKDGLEVGEVLDDGDAGTRGTRWG